MNRLEGRRAVVTGAGSGIGRASALRFAAEGAKVLAVGRTQAGIDETIDMVRAAGGTAIGMTADAADEASVEAAVARCVQELGGLEVFFANAGITDKSVPLVDQTVADWNEVLRVNLIGPFLAAKYASRHMLANGGSIIITSSVASLRANAGTIAYSASKAAVNSVTQCVANALAGTGIRVNAILSGLVETKISRTIFERARERGTESKLGSLNPLRRPGRPEEIAAMAAFLASDDASYMTGQLIAVDGGISSTHPGRITV